MIIMTHYCLAPTELTTLFTSSKTAKLVKWELLHSITNTWSSVFSEMILVSTPSVDHALFSSSLEDHRDVKISVTKINSHTTKL